MQKSCITNHKSLRCFCLVGHNESPLVVNDVELPQWLFPEAEKPENGIDVSAELEEAVRDAEAANLSSHDDQAHEAAAEMDLNAAALDTTATKNDQPPGASMFRCLMTKQNIVRCRHDSKYIGLQVMLYWHQNLTSQSQMKRVKKVRIITYQIFSSKLT